MSREHDGSNIVNGFFNVLKHYKLTSKVYLFLNVLPVYSFFSFFAKIKAQNLDFVIEKLVVFLDFLFIIIALHTLTTFFLAASCYHPRQRCK